MQVIYAQKMAPEIFSKSVFLVGPTPRDKETASWRPIALDILRDIEYDGVVFVPELGYGKFKGTYAGCVGEGSSEHVRRYRCLGAAGVGIDAGLHHQCRVRSVRNFR